MGWKDIELEYDLIGEQFTKGSGMWEKNYRYISIPNGYGYDNYVFMLSEKLICLEPDSNNLSYFSVCDDMNFELLYNPSLRETGKKYKRYKLSAKELYKKIFEPYESVLEQIKDEAREKINNRNRSKIGKIICGRYTGNIYGTPYNKYNYQNSFCSFFTMDRHIFSNNTFEKVQNVQVEFVIIDNISKYDFLRYESLINEYISDYNLYFNMYLQLTIQLNRNGEKIQTTDVTEHLAETTKEAMETVKERLHSTLLVLSQKGE